MFIVRGEFETVKNGEPSSVIIDILCKTEEEAQIVKSERVDFYTNLKIVEK